jgi:hypothetical protein
MFISLVPERPVGRDFPVRNFCVPIGSILTIDLSSFFTSHLLVDVASGSDRSVDVNLIAVHREPEPTTKAILEGYYFVLWSLRHDYLLGIFLSLHLIQRNNNDDSLELFCDESLSDLSSIQTASESLSVLVIFRGTDNSHLLRELDSVARITSGSKDSIPCR